MTIPSSQAIHLLIVDDDDQLRQTLARRFQRHRMTVTAAANGEEALAKTADNRYDVALLDLHMPGMSGIELLEKLKERLPELEALMLTAHGSMETAILAMKKGAYDYGDRPLPFLDALQRNLPWRARSSGRSVPGLDPLECLDCSRTHEKVAISARFAERRDRRCCVIRVRLASAR